MAISLGLTVTGNPPAAAVGWYIRANFESRTEKAKKGPNLYIPCRHHHYPLCIRDSDNSICLSPLSFPSS